MTHLVMKEEKIANQVAKLLSDVSLDLEKVGEHYAKANSTLFVNRLVIMAEQAYETKKGVKNHVGLHQHANV